MPVRRARYKPALNSQCLCGSGFKFKRCCLGENDIHCGKMTKSARDLMIKKDYRAALKFVRHGITNYTILHKTNTAPYISSKNEGVLWVLDIDIRVLSELIESLLDCYRGLGDYQSFECDLERLRINISDVRWQRKITYFQIIASLGDHWSEKVGKKEVKKLLPMNEENDVEIIQLYLHFCLEELSFKKSLDLLDRLILLVEEPAEKLQYTVVKAIQYLCIGDESEAKNLIEKAINDYESTEWRDDSSYGHMQHARAISLLGDLQKSTKLKVQSINEFSELLENHSWTDLGMADIHFEIGKSLFHVKRFDEAIEQYRKSLEVNNSEIIKVFLSQAQLELDDQSAICTIKEVEIAFAELSESERLDFIFTYAAIGISFKQRDMIEKSLDLLTGISPVASIFEKQKSKLISDVSILLQTGDLKEKSKLLVSLKTILRMTTRYLILQPNIAGLGININNIADDLGGDLTEKTSRTHKSAAVFCVISV